MDVFDLSIRARKEIAALKGLTVYSYGVKYVEDQGDLIDIAERDPETEEGYMDVIFADRDFGERVKASEIFTSDNYVDLTFSREEDRIDKDLITVIERLGADANGRYGNVEIVEWESGKEYMSGAIFKWGQHESGKSQLWITIREVLSQAHYPPETDITAYKKITFTESGIPIWTQPLTYEDAYDIGDKVEHPQGSGVIWICEQGNANGQYGIRNTFEPGVWGWSN